MRLKPPTLDSVVPLLVAFVVTSIVSMTFINYAICNFKVIESLHYLHLVGGFGKDKRPPSKCDDNTSQSIQTLMSLLATIIALKADLKIKKSNDEDGFDSSSHRD